MSDPSRAPITQTPRPRPGLYTLHTDGGVVAEPGLSGGVGAIGAALKNSANLLVEAISRRIGEVPDHHVAEFRALVEGLRMARRHGVGKIRVFTDSELVVRSLKEDINLRSPEHRALRDQARRLYAGFPDAKLSWVPREMNTEADLLASAALPVRPTRG
jgi:ribonuclease HI